MKKLETTWRLWILWRYGFYGDTDIMELEKKNTNIQKSL